MSTAVDIPGGTAWLRDASDLRERHKRLVRTAMVPLAHIFAAVPPELAKAAGGDGPEAEAARRQAQRLVNQGVRTRQDAAAMKEVDDALLVASLSSWTLPGELPTMDTVQDLDSDVYDALLKAIGGEQGAAVMQASLPTDFGPTDKRDAESPFGSSSGSAGRSNTTARARTRSAKRS